MKLFNWFKKATGPYQGSSDEFITIHKELEDDIKAAKTMDDLSVVIAKLGVLVEFTETQGDLKLYNRIKATYNVKLMQIKIDT